MIRIKNLKIEYDHVLLEQTDFNIPNQSFTLIKGVSGSGKTSLLYRLALISENKDFEYYLFQEDLNKKTPQQQSLMRKEYITFITQDNILFEHYDVLGNLKMYSHINNKKYSEEEYKNILNIVGLQIPLHQSLDTLSGGQKQRLAIACAICKDTPIIILDEPTSALDKENAVKIFELLAKLAHQYHKTVIISSHSEIAMNYADQVFEIQNKKLIELKQFENNEDINRVSHQGVSLSFVMKYICYFFKKYKLNEFVLTMIVILSLVFMNLSMVIIQNNTAQSIEEYQSLSNNQMFVVQNEEESYVDENLKAFEYQNHQKEDSQIYPYLRTYIKIGQMIVPVVPIYDTKELSKYKVLDYGEEHIYLSYSLHQELARSINDFKNMSTMLMIEYCQDDQRYIQEHPLNLSVGGTLKQETPCHYLKDNELYMYIDYDILKTIYEEEKLDQLDKYIGYTIICNDFDTYIEMYQNMQNDNVGVRLFFPYITQMQDLTKMNYMIEYGILGILSLITLLLFNIMEVQYFYKREKELIMLKLNGLNDVFISQVIFVEMLIQCFISMILNSLLLAICSTKFHFVLLDTLLFNGIFMMILLMCGYILVYRNIKRLSIEKVLRD